MIVEAKQTDSTDKKIGEILSIFGEPKEKFQILQLNPRDLTPFFKGNEDKLKFFTCDASRCRILDKSRLRKKDSFMPGDVVRHSRNGRLRFGIIIGFTHPEGLYSDSLEKGYNGKDLIECVEISGRAGLPPKLDNLGKVKRFTVGPEHLKICEIGRAHV